MALTPRTERHVPAGLSSSGGTAYRAGWFTVGLAGAVAALVLFASGMRLVAGSFLPLSILALLLCITHVVYGRLRPNQHLSLVPGLLAMLIISAIFAAIISHAGLRFRFPLIDAFLSAADSALGIDTPRLALTLALHRGWGWPLHIVYLSAFPIVFATAIALGLCGYKERSWELGFLFSFSIITASIIAIFFPAIGAMVYHRVDITAGLPAGAGNYHLAAVQYFRDGKNSAFDLARVSGVVTFPSFHMVMAIIVPYSLRRTGLGWVAAGWGALVMVSAIAIGGHYVIDLIAGSTLWALAAWIVHPRRSALPISLHAVKAPVTDVGSLVLSTEASLS